MLSEELLRLTGCEGKNTQGEGLVLNMDSLNQINEDKETPAKNLNFIAKILVLFIELMTTHMTKATASALIDFITEIIIYMSATEQNIDS